MGFLWAGNTPLVSWGPFGTLKGLQTTGVTEGGVFVSTFRGPLQGGAWAVLASPGVLWVLWALQGGTARCYINRIMWGMGV
jgi:hypothetical protein